MNYFKIISITIFFLIISNINGQEVEWGEKDDKDTKRLGSIDFISTDNGETYGFEYESTSSMSYITEMKLLKFDNELNEVKSYKLDKVKSYYPGTTKGVIYNNQVVIFSIKFKMLKKGISVLKHVFDLEGNFISEEVLTTDELASISMNRTDIFFSNSNNFEKVSLILLDNKIKKEKVTSSIYDFDLKLNKFDKFQNEIVVDSELKGIKLVEYSITDENNKALILYGSIYANYSVYKYTLVTFNNDKELINEVLKLEDYNLIDIELKLTEDNQLFFSGKICTTEKKKQQVNGFFYSQLNREFSEVKSITPFFFNAKFFDKMSYKVKSNGTVPFYGYYSTRLELRKNGGFLIASHEDLAKARELVVFEFDENNNVQEPIIIPRSISATLPKEYIYLNYFSFVRSEKLYLIYSDNLENLKVKNRIETSPTFINNSKTGAVCSIVGGSENLSRKKLFSKKQAGGYLNPERCFVYNGMIVISVTDGKEEKTGELKL